MQIRGNPRKSSSSKPATLLFTQTRVWISVFCFYIIFVNDVVYSTENPKPLSSNIGVLNTSNCVVIINNKTYDLNPLRKWNPWSIKLNQNGKLSSFEINVCNGLHVASKEVDDPCIDSFICKSSNTKRELLADRHKEITVSKIPLLDDTLFLTFNGPPCTESKSSPPVNKSVVLTLTCGSYLGYPRVDSETQCKTTMTWATSIVCSGPPKSSQVPCSVYDDAGRFYDLTPLVGNKKYFVHTHDGSEFMAINVCSDLGTGVDETTSKCPKNISSCVKRNGNYLPAGSLTGPLRLKSNETGLKLSYESTIKIGDCTGPSKTVINFMCPTNGMGKQPVLVTSSDCVYRVYWETEYACPSSVLQGNVTLCKFQPDIHGVNIDLSSLRKLPGQLPYNVSGIVKGSPVVFYLNVCGGLGKTFKCGNSSWSSNTVCMKQKDGNRTETVFGNSMNSILRYASNELTLEYSSPKKCDSGSEYWKNIIKFICNQNKSESGVGYPKFIAQEGCVNFFEWSTRNACVRKRSFECSVNGGPLSVILNPLYRQHSEATWKAIDSVSPSGSNRDIFMDLCDGRDIIGATQPCSAESSICMTENNETVSLGRKTEKMKYQFLNGTHTYQVEFSGGDPCPGGLKKSVLTLVCDETSFTTSPVLIDETPCQYYFKWHTYAACQHQKLAFEDCKFKDSKGVVSIDLNPLMSKTFYEIKTDKYNYYINICGPVRDTPCNFQGMVKARGCQVDKDENQKNPRAWNLGETALGLAYDEGEFINLTYTGGTPYRDNKRTPRAMSIALLCDPDAGHGKPEFNGEQNRAYAFLWRTSLVCDTQDIAKECVVYDHAHQKQYDLSRLTKSTKLDDWTLMDAEGKKKFYLNVCRPLNKARGCDKQSAACVVQQVNKHDVPVITNLGKPLQSPQLTSDGHLQLHYTLGDSCVSYGKETNYTVMINFICSTKSLESQGPKFLGVYGNCSYSFLWATEAACAIGKEEFHDCSYTDPQTGLSFDLNPLHKRDGFYELKTKTQTFQLNICGPVGGTGCPSSKQNEQVSVCELHTDGKALSILGMAEAGIISAFEGLPVMITYLGFRNETHQPTVKFIFECDPSAKQPDISFIRHIDAEYYFSVATVLVCQPELSKCNVISERGTEFNLASLVRNGSSYWTVKEPGENSFYHLSLCGAITGVGGVECHGVGACMMNKNAPYEGISLGKQVKDPIIIDDTIVISYEGGSPCKYNLTASAVVVLHCSLKETSPKLVSKRAETCEYSFVMHTPAACQLKEFKGSNCQVMDRAFNNLYDLSPLSKKTENYVSKGGEHTYLLNVCEDIINPPEGCLGSAICQTKKNSSFSVNAGKSNAELSYKDGLIQLVYKDGKSNCHKQYNRSTIITFVCDQSTNGSSGPQFLNEDHDCTYLFQWPTLLACPPFLEKSCSAEDNEGRFYDLGALSLPNKNYFIENPNNPHQKFIINVCRSVVHGPESRCPHQSSACLFDSDSTSSALTKAVSLGIPTESPKFEDGILKIHYKLGEICRSEGTFLRYMETVIEFKCDEMAYGSEPEFLAFKNCQYSFIWFTPSACPKLRNNEVSGNCSLTDPITGHDFNFSSLRNIEVSVQSSPNHKFQLAICGEIKDSPCGKGSGSCQMEHADDPKSLNGGMANSEIIYHEGIMYLNYSNGELCHNGVLKKSTIIQFTCAKDLSPGESKVSFVAELSNCTYYFNWYTNLACDSSDSSSEANTGKEVDCKVTTKNGRIDLSAMNSDTYMTIGNPEMEGVYFLSVCKRVSNSLISLPEDASAGCWHCFNNESLSLGEFLTPPFINTDNVVEMNYQNGSTCLKDPTKKMSSKILFFCGNRPLHSELEVVGSSDDGCEIQFQFETPVVCPIKSKTCEFGHRSKDFHLELSAFENFSTPFEVVYGKDKYIISICKPLEISNCSGAGVCLENDHGNVNFGLVKNSFVYHNTIHMTLTYDSDTNCSDSETGRRHTEIKFYCDPSAGLGKPQFYKKYSCKLVFLWATAEVCSSKQPVCTLWTKDQKLYDLRVLSSISHSWKVPDESGNVYWLNMCREINNGAVAISNFTCPPYSSSCIFSANGDAGKSLGSVLTQKLRVDETTKDIILSYDHGDDSLCNHLKPTSTGLSNQAVRASTEIRLKCGSHTGFPKFVSGPTITKCVYEFQWDTLLACPELEDEPLFEKNGIIYDRRLQMSGIVINITSLMTSTFIVTEPDRDAGFSYYINLGPGVKDNVSDPLCKDAFVCQTKLDNSFFRDIGSVGTKKFYLRGSEMKLFITSHGRKCGKNHSKNVTTVINFQCSSAAAGLGSPVFHYESGDCDYMFNWETSAVCAIHNVAIETSTFHRRIDHDSTHSTASFSISAVFAIVFSVLLALVLIGVLAKKERRNAVKVKVRNCFQRVRLPRYRYMQCYFLRLRGDLASQNSRSEGEAVLLAPDDPFPNKFHDDSDVDPIS